jgi:archaellum component FlaC
VPQKNDRPDSDVARCIQVLRLSGIETFETNSHCVKEEEKDAEEDEKEEGSEEEHSEEEHPEEEHAAEEHTGEEPSGDEHSGEEAVEAVESKPELQEEEIPESECSEENGPDNLPLLPGADVLGYTYDPDFGPENCKFDRCVMRPFIRFTFKNCKVVETPAGMFKVPDQIFAYNLFETSARTHIFQNEKEELKHQAVEAHVEGSYGPVSASVKTSNSQSSETSSKQHIAVRKIDVQLYRLTLLNTKSFNSLVPEFKDAFKALPPRFEHNAHDYLQFLRDWGRYVPTSGTFGGTVELKMKFFSSSKATKEEMSVGVEMAYASATVSASGGVNYGKGQEAKEVENNNEISLTTSGGDPAIGAMISDIHAPETMNFREDLQQWLVSLPKFPRLIENWPSLAVMTKFIPNSPDEEGFDPFTRNQGLDDAMRIMHENGATSLFDKRLCYPPLPLPDVSQLVTLPAPKVRIFEHCNFGGESLALAPGDYDVDTLRNLGGFDFVNHISSLRIDDGFTVVLFSQPNFLGATLALDSSNPCLVGEHFNDKTQSLKVFSGPKNAKGKMKTGKLSVGKISLAFNDFDRINVDQCISFVAETDGDIDAYFFSSPRSQLTAYSFHVTTSYVTLERGLSGNSVVLKKSTSTDAAAYGTASLPQKVWFCMFPDTENPSSTVFQYGRGSDTLFEYSEEAPVNINYFALDCSKAATYRNIVVLQASRWLGHTKPFSRVCSILNCAKVQDTESLSGTCGCQQCAVGYEPLNNNQECVVAEQCPAQFGCLSATPPDCTCDECCCGLSFDPVSRNCVNANLFIRPGTALQDNIWTDSLPRVPGLSMAFNRMENKFKVGSSYRMKKVSFACTETNLQNIRVSYDESKPAQGFIDYDSTHLVSNSDTAGKFDFSIYDNLRKSVQANPLFSTAGFLNLDEVKLEKVTLVSMAKKSANLFKDAMNIVANGAKAFAADVKNKINEVSNTVNDVKKKVEEGAQNLKAQAEKLGKDLKDKAEEIAKIADGEAQKFMNAAKKAYNDVASVAQQVSQTAVNFIAQNADLLKTLNAAGGAIAGSLAAGLPQLLNLIPAWLVALLNPLHSKQSSLTHDFL